MAEYATIKMQGDVASEPLFKPSIGVGCLVCNEYVGLSEGEERSLLAGLHLHSKVCDKCREAIMRVRKEIENEELVKERD